MKIRKLKLHNFRQFVGTQEVEFSIDSEKNVTVLIGINTSGKTTLVRAFEWVLYGKNEFDDKDLLSQNVAENMQMGETQKVIGTLYLEHNSKEYEITREQTYTCTGSGIRASVSSAKIMYFQPDGQTKTEIETDFGENIERILPMKLSSYFFFGGERIGSISNDDSIEDAVKGLMGLDILFNAITHLKAVVRKMKGSIVYEEDKNTTITRQKLEGAYTKKKECEDELKTVDEQIDYYQSEKEKYAALLKANKESEEDQRRREKIDSVIKELSTQIEKDKKDLMSAFSKDSFAFFSVPLLKRVAEFLNANKDTTESVPEMNALAIEYILNRGVCICGTRIEKGSSEETHLLAEQKIQPPEHIGSLVREYKNSAVIYMANAENYFPNIEKQFSSLRRNRREYGLRIDERVALDKKLINAKDSKYYEQEYQNAISKNRSFETRRNELQRMIGGCETDIANYESSLEKRSKADIKNARILSHIEYTQAVLDWVNDAYISRESKVREKLEEKVNKNFGLMYHGHRTLSINDKYRVKYIDVTTEESDGLKAVKSFAFVSGLVELAKEAMLADKADDVNIGPQYYPLVMDAPFSNVDEIHISNISKILPKSAEQVIIAVMQKDWEPASEILSQVVGKSYRIEKAKDANNRDIDTMSYIR